MPRLSLTRKLRFSAAHRYHRPEWSDEENRRVFGPCANPHGHGHDYLLEVTVSADVDPLTGFSADLGALDRILHEEVSIPLDHQHLNHAVADFGPGAKIPTSENILLWIHARVAPRIEAPMALVRLRLHENPDFYVDLEP